MSEKNQNRFLHIGFGKAGTTLFQEYIIPIICETEKINYFKKNYKLFSSIKDHVDRMRSDSPIKNIHVPENTIISYEALMSWNPNDWEKFSKKNKEAFGENFHVIIFIRNPYSYFTSLYNEISLHSAKYKKVNEFFSLKNDSYPYGRSAAININEFSYNKIINLYKNNFNKVTIIKFESISNLKFIYELFPSVNETNIKDLKKIILNKKINKSYSIITSKIYFVLFSSLHKIISFFLKNNLLLKITRIIAIKKIKKHYPSYLINNVIHNLPKVNNKIFSIKIAESIFITFKIHKIFQFIDIIIPYKKYIIEFDETIKNRIFLLNNEYELLKDIETFEND